MRTLHPDDLEAILERLDACERGGLPPNAVAATWRFAGILDPDEVSCWLDVGVYDGHRAGLLKLAGVTHLELLAHPHSRAIGLDFSLGRLSVLEVRTLLRSIPESV